MKAPLTAKRIAILLIISIVLSLGIFRWHDMTNVPFCINSAGCTGDETVNGQKRIGNIMVKDFGFPLEYRHTEEFTYKNPPNPRQNGQTGTTTAKIERPGFSLPSVVINVVFWFALLVALNRFIPWWPKSPASKDAGSPEVVAKQ